MGIEVINPEDIPATINILFVVRDPKTLSLELGKLGNRNPKWEVNFVSSSCKALECLKNKKFDVVFCELILQDSSGVDFLNQVRNFFPYIVRILFTDSNSPESTLTKINSAHQYLFKNSQPETIINTACRALYLNKYLPDTELKNVLKNIDSLPSLPDVYKRIMYEISSPNASISQIHEIIESDEVISTKIHQLMSSSYFPQLSQVASINQAATILGVDTLLGIVVNTQILKEADLQTFPINIESLIGHSISIGKLAKQIAQVECLDRASCDHAMMAGMLHDIGRIVMAKIFPERYNMVNELLMESHLTINEAEKHLFSASHGEIGAYMLGLWGLPEMVVEAVAFHHHPWLSNNSKFNPTTAVYIADVLLNVQDSDNKEPLESFNEKFLKNFNRTHKIPVWQELKNQIVKGK